MGKRTAETVEVRDGRRLPFAAIEHGLIDRFGRELGPVGLAVYLGLLRHANQDGTCWPSHARLGQMIGVARETVQRQIPRLVALELIAIEPLPGNRRIYRLLPLPCDSKSQGVAADDHKGCDSRSQGVAADDHKGCDVESHELEPGTRTSEPEPVKGKPGAPLGAAAPAAPDPSPPVPHPIPDGFHPTLRSEQVATALLRDWFPDEGASPAAAVLVSCWLYGGDGTGRTTGELAEFTRYWGGLPRSGRGAARGRKADWQRTFQNSLASEAARKRLLALVQARRRETGGLDRYGRTVAEQLGLDGGGDGRRRAGR